MPECEWIETDDGSYTLYNKEFREAYHSHSGAWAECQNVFLRPFLVQLYLSRKNQWSVLDVGFGLGLNWLCYVNTFLHRVTPLLQNEDADEAQKIIKTVPRLEIVSLERDPEVLKVKLLPQPLGNFPIHNRAFELLNELKCSQTIQTDKIQANVMIGDAKDSLAKLAETGKKFDVILQDPFSPKKNPECWDLEFFQRVAQCCQKGSILLTYSVAVAVRNNLKTAGFSVKKVPGFGDKKEQLVAVFNG